MAGEGVLYAFSQSAYTYVTNCFRRDSEVGANLVPPNGVQELKQFLVPAVRTRQKVSSSTISSGAMKRFLRCERA